MDKTETNDPNRHFVYKKRHMLYGGLGGLAISLGLLAPTWTPDANIGLYVIEVITATSLTSTAAVLGAVIGVERVVSSDISPENMPKGTDED